MTTRDEPPVYEREGSAEAESSGAGTRVLLTLRVSRDSGRTWGPITELRDNEGLPLLDNPGASPTCACPRCTSRDSDAGAPVPEAGV